MKNTKILFVGDIYTDRRISLDKSIKNICFDHSLCVFNLEGCFSSEKNKIIKAGPHLAINPEDIEEIFDNFKLAILANNHIMDYGIEGLINTISYCKHKDCNYIGAGTNLNNAFRSFETEKYTIIAVSEHEFGGASDTHPGIATTENIRLIFKKITSSKIKNKKVIIICHGGTELLSFPPPYIKEQYKLWIDYGADLVIGNHPHVAQGIEKYNEKIICYSLGNFVFLRNNTPHNNESTWSIAVSYDFENNHVDLIPISFNNLGNVKSHNFIEFKNKIENLNKKITSPMYEELYAKESVRLFESWYKRLKPLSTDDAALILHYFRCDAHRHFITTALSRIIGENSKKQSSHNEANCNRQINNAQLACCEIDKSTKMMQMTLNEQKFLQNILTGKKLYLEIGSGYSTIYFSQFVNKLVSVETRKIWFQKIKNLLQELNIQNVELFLYEPESCAYDSNGNEKWTCRNNSPYKTDYGQPHEFTSYLQKIRNLCTKNLFDVILVDGNVRKEIVQILIDINYKGVILLHDVLKERKYLNDPILKNKNINLIDICDSLAHLGVKANNQYSNRNQEKIKIQVGATTSISGWITTNIGQLDITNQDHFEKLFLTNSIDTILAEHVIEHLSVEDFIKFLNISYNYLKPGGYIRIAIPDKNHPSRFYRDLCRAGGSDIGSEGHKVFYNREDIETSINPKKFSLEFLEWWDDKGFHKNNWHNDEKHGFVKRSAQYYDGKFTRSNEMRELLYGTTEQKFLKFYDLYNITYTSLIFDLYKI